MKNSATRRVTETFNDSASIHPLVAFKPLLPSGCGHLPWHAKTFTADCARAPALSMGNISSVRGGYQA